MAPRSSPPRNDQVAEIVNPRRKTRIDNRGRIGLLEDRGAFDSGADRQAEPVPYRGLVPRAIEPDRPRATPGARKAGIGSGSQRRQIEGRASPARRGPQVDD